MTETAWSCVLTPGSITDDGEHEDHDGPMLTVEALAERWSVNVKTIYESIRLGQVRAVRVGKKVIRIPRAAVEALERGHGRAMPPGGERGGSP